MSPVLQPDTSQAEDFTQPIEPGTYKARIVACEVGKSKAGNNKIVPKFEIDVQGKKRTRQSHLVVSGEGAAGFDQLLRACHMDDLAKAYKGGSGPAFDTDSLVGQELQVVVEEQLYEGQKRDQIKTFLKA